MLYSYRVKVDWWSRIVFQNIQYICIYIFKDKTREVKVCIIPALKP